MCYGCGADDKKLDLHHRTYKRLGNEHYQCIEFDQKFDERWKYECDGDATDVYEDVTKGGGIWNMEVLHYYCTLFIIKFSQK